MPYQHAAGRMKIVPFDNAGNEGAATTLDVSVDSVVTNVYVQTTGAAEPLSTGGIPLVGLQGDDRVFGNLALPFDFRFFERLHGAVSVSTNKALYFTAAPSGTDALSTFAGLRNHAMIAGLWDDLRTDRRTEDGVFMVQPDPDRVIFRWQGVTFDTSLPGGGTRGEHPVSFEIELQRSGGIVIRYGAGNTNVRPIVGVSGGEREPYFVGSHSSENALINLTNAPVLRFSQPPCSSSITGLDPTVPANGYSGFVSVHTGPACAWTAYSNASWITIFYGANSVGSDNVSLGIAANQSILSRSGSVTIAGHTITVNQPGIACSYQVGVNVLSFPSSGGPGLTSVIATGDCPWTATTSDPWITITSATSGSGNGVISFSLAANPSHSPRSGTIRIADQSVTINQDSSHPADDPQFFVRQHYLDFFNREPDSGGQFWVDNILACGGDQDCRAVKRIDTSAAFFLSIEFQETGYLVHRFYRASFGRRPQFSEFQTDTQSVGNGVIVGQAGWQQRLESNKVAFANFWVTRPAFAAAYGGSNNTAFVNTLIANTGATFAQADRDALITALNSSTKTRAQVLRDIAENQAFYNAEFNSAFVQMQYFGYLRRNPQDPPDNNLDGFNFWLNKLNQFGGDFRRAEMVKAFINSGEYRQRFLSPQ